MSDKFYFTKTANESFGYVDNIYDDLQDALNDGNQGEEVYECTPKLIGHVKEPDEENTLEPIKSKKKKK